MSRKNVLKIKENKFISGIIALMTSQAIVKVFGMLYSLYLTNKTGFGDHGNAIYISAYQVFALFLTISSMGIPSSISKLVSEKNVIGDYRGVNKIFKVSIIIFGILGFLETLILFLGAKFITNNILNISDGEYSLILLSPAIFFVTISSVMEGYLNGINEISKSAKVKIFEQFFKMIFIIILVEYVSEITGNNTMYMATAANLGTSIAIIFSTIYLIIICYKVKIKKLKFKMYKQESSIKILLNILKVAIPLTISAILVGLNKNIDSITVVRFLKNAIGESEAIARYGILTSKVDTIVVVPLSFNIAFSVALLPEIAALKVKGNYKEIDKKINLSLLLSLIIGIPSTFGIYLFSEPIINLLFPRANTGAELLKLASFTIPFQILIQTISGAMQGLGKNKYTMLIMGIGTLVKLISNIIFLKFTNLLEKSAIMGTMICNISVFIIMYITLKYKCKIKLKIFRKSLNIILISLIMGVLSNYIYKMYFIKRFSNNISLIFSILIAIIVYFSLIFKAKIVKKEEFL